MTKIQRLLRDFEALHTSLRINYAELAREITPKERRTILSHIAMCIAELRKLESTLSREH